MVLEIRQGFYELTCVFIRNNIGCMLGTQRAYEVREKTFDCAHDKERKMNDIMHDTMCYAERKVTHECSEINMREYEGDAGNIPVKACAFAGKQPRATFCLICGKNEKTDEKRERNEIEDKRSHGN